MTPWMTASIIVRAILMIVLIVATVYVWRACNEIDRNLKELEEYRRDREHTGPRNTR